MQTIHFADFCSGGTQLVGACGFTLLSVDCELIVRVPILASCSSPVGDIESCCLWLRASDKRR